MEWEKEISARAAARGGWRDDLPLDRELPGTLGLDCRKLELPIHPMFAVRLRTFIDWHRDDGRQVLVKPPLDSAAHRLFTAMRIDPQADPTEEDDAIVPITRMREFNEVEQLAEQTQEVLEYQLPDLAPLGHATFMAIAISDLGIGIPEHIRQQYPEWGEDGSAIAHATQERVSGTGNPHRGIGFSAVMEAALTSSLHAARMDILSANGFCRLQSVQETPKVEVFPASRFRRGTWITYDLVSV